MFCSLRIGAGDVGVCSIVRLVRRIRFSSNGVHIDGAPSFGAAVFCVSVSLGPSGCRSWSKAAVGVQHLAVDPLPVR